jgi:UDP-glucose 4-epimerase
MEKQTILVTGGAGYIGAHAVRKLVAEGYGVVVVDNLSFGLRDRAHPKAVFIEGDFGDENILMEIFSSHKIDSVMHFAASIEVGESVEKPLEYLDNNTAKTNNLLNAMSRSGIRKLIFSSTAAVYGHQEKVPISEDAKLGPIDPYGNTKMLSERLIEFHSKFAGLNAIVFRYFNACGSDFDLAISDRHTSHLFPIIKEVLDGRRAELSVLGDDYATPDGTGVRDYVHVLDIAAAHVVGLNHLQTQSGFEIYNIGTGIGLSVKEIIDATERFTGRKLPYKIQPRRPGDAPITVADNSKIKEKLGYEIQYSDINTIIETSLK